MKRNSFFFILPVCFLLSSWGSGATTEQFNYEVIVYNRTIGTFSATRTELNERAEYLLETNISTRIIKKIEFDFAMMSSYEDSKLVHADLKNYMNNQLRKSSTVDYDGSKYLIKTDEKTMTHNASEVRYSSASLYFQEPKGRDFLFSENYGVNLPIKEVSAHKYMIKLPNGDKNYYEYQNGEVVSVEFDKAIINVKMKRKSS
ncbi:MAG: DUF6134 family protein [Flavobacteriales bacterium]